MVGRHKKSLSIHETVVDRPDKPTPETVAKLRRDVVERLHNEGRLQAEHFRAANEIRRVWEAVGRGIFPGAHKWDHAGQPHQKGMFRDPIDRMTEAEEIMWRRRYRPWAREMSLEIAAGVVRVSRLQVVLDIVVDNYGLRQVEAWYRMRHGVAYEHVLASLNRYAELSGWLGEK